MANNVFYVKRTAVSGRTPNTTASYSTNAQYIAAGELALNMADGVLYTSNGSSIIVVGSNVVNQSVTDTLTVSKISANGSLGSGGQFLTSSGTGLYWSTANTTANSFPSGDWGTLDIPYDAFGVLLVDNYDFALPGNLKYADLNT